MDGQAVANGPQAPSSPGNADYTIPAVQKQPSGAVSIIVSANALENSVYDAAATTGAGAMSRKFSQALGGALPPSPMPLVKPGTERSAQDNQDHPGPYPMPKWPTNHSSAAFEAVAYKKSLILSPAEIYAECAHHGEEKAKFHWLKLILLCTVSGCYVGFGFTLCLMVGGNVPRSWLTDSPGLFSLVYGAVGFPFAFTTISVCGSELFTSLCAYMTAAWWEGKVRTRDCFRMWTVSWCLNFLGCGIFIGLMVAAGTYEHKEWYTLYLAHSKVSKSWWQVFFRGIFANWLVGIATWMCNAAQDMTGKAVAIWLPISAFGMIGFEHCIANQFVIPMAMALGADISAREFIWFNLVPSTLGNWIGGAVCMATLYAFIYGSAAIKVTAWLEKRVAWFEKKGAVRTARLSKHG